MRTQECIKRESEHCATCGVSFSVYATEHTPGYGTDESGKRRCYKCCGRQCRQQMIDTGGPVALYDCLPLDSQKREVTDWPGYLRFEVTGSRAGSHNIAGKQYHVWFNGPDGHVWHGVRYGDNTQIVRCKRTQRKVGA